MDGWAGGGWIGRNVDGWACRWMGGHVGGWIGRNVDGNAGTWMVGM